MMKQLTIEDNEIKLKLVNKPSKGKPGQILVKVHAAGLNRADLLQARGLYPSPDGSQVPGLELSGIRMDTKEPVCALVSSGALSEYLWIDHRLLMPIPRSLDLTTAAGLPESLIVCWLNLIKLGKIKPGQAVLIHGGSSGLGSFAVQFAKAFACQTFTTVGNQTKVNFCQTLGADKIFNYHDDNFAFNLQEIGGVDLVLDILGGSYLGQSLSCLKKRGKLIMIAAMAGVTITIDGTLLLRNNLTIIGSTLRSKSVTTKQTLIAQAVSEVYPLIENNKIKPIIDSTFAIEDFAEAFGRMEKRQNLGKILILF